ncbi:ecdysone-induced protein 78C-like [Uloborus diversus]|uniref:ecdysone-induced protein 78C-like n=1 Tax=Uloborus diversus TaxID=327109 RepID=UPI002409F8EB|nr:ecdysone-induced protein 78C-like [Uloborus diversus]XP_054708134.1 ecdysone-induced protein 78C-like [Uloborus diversus]XP_054708135.1 ecdysone-induced protein 78C-like [Uloborus diversus]
MSKDSVRYGRVPKRSREKSEEPPQVTQSEPEKAKPAVSNLELREQKMYETITAVSDAHLSHCGYTVERTKNIVRKPAIFAMTEHQHNAVEGQVGAGSLELQKIIMWQQFASLLTPSIQQIVEFAKRIPGFQDLIQDDKLLCIKLGFFEIWLVHAARLINPMDGTITFNDGSYVSKNQLEVMFDREFVSLVFNFVCWFNDLQLNDIEIGLYCAVVLLTAERDGIYDHKAIQMRQEKVIEALKCLLNDNHPSEPHMFATLISRLPELRILGEKHLDHLRWFRANWVHINLAPLFAEVFDIPKSDLDLVQR